MNTKLILTLLATVFASIAAPTKSYAGWPFSSSSCRSTYQPQCYSQPRYYQPSCQTYRPVQYYQPQCSQQYYPQQYSSGQYYPTQRSGQCYPQQYYPQQQYSSGQCYQQYRPPTVVYIYHPPVFTTTTRVTWQSRATQPSCQNGRCSSR